MIKKQGRGKRYSSEFKEEALARCDNYGTKKTSDDLGVPVGTLNRWKHEQEENLEKNSIDTDKPSYKDLEKEVRRLKKELGYVNEINRVLKKSTAIFSKSELGDLK